MTTCRGTVRGVPVVVEGSGSVWIARVWTGDGWLVSYDHSRYASAMAAGVRMAEDHVLERAYLMADRESRWERRERNANRLRAAWALVLTVFIVWALFGPPTEPRRAELRERWETNQ